MDPIVQSLLPTLIGLVTPQLVYLVLGTLVGTQCAKVLLQLQWPDVPTQLVVFVIAPAVGMLLSFHTWSAAPTAPWYVAGLVVSLLSNVVYWLFFEQLLARFAPDLHALANNRPPPSSPPTSGSAP